jgi:hypothetical protein
MKRLLVVLFVLCSLTGFAQVNRPANLSFNGLADFIRNFDFIASSTELPTIASKGVQLIDWSDTSYPELMISNNMHICNLFRLF